VARLRGAVLSGVVLKAVGQVKVVVKAADQVKAAVKVGKAVKVKIVAKAQKSTTDSPLL
jgi:hypothetical protein